jgi:predicted TIM-barrel fold metal-dependent hydrolase
MTRPPAGFRYIDVHTHLHPEWLTRAIRRWFREHSNWTLAYPTEPGRVAAFLHERAVERFVFFSYAHKAGIAREINTWLWHTARQLPAGIPLGTVHPDDPDMLDVAEQALGAYGFPGFKVHINVQRFYPDDPRVLPLYERLCRERRLLLIHVGSAPWPNGFDGFPRFARVMERYPELTVVVAHMGSWETRQFLELMERCPNLYLDTTMAFAPVRPEHQHLDRLNQIDVADEDLVRWQDRILFGSDFPNLPYPWEDERDALWMRDLPTPVYRKIFHDNAAQLLAAVGCRV